MSRNSKLNDEERIRAVQEYLEGNGSYKVIAGKYGLSPGRLRKLVIRAQIEGIESIRISSTNKKYSRETKIAAVQEYIYLKSRLENTITITLCFLLLMKQSVSILTHIRFSTVTEDFSIPTNISTRNLSMPEWFKVCPELEDALTTDRWKGSGGF